MLARSNKNTWLEQEVRSNWGTTERKTQRAATFLAEWTSFMEEVRDSRKLLAEKKKPGISSQYPMGYRNNEVKAVLKTRCE